MLRLLLALLVGYVLGGIPTGALVARAYKVDLTKVGSQRTGATNVLRTLGVRAAAMVFLGDLLKSVAAAGLARALFRSPRATALAGIGAVFGHGYSPYLGLRGGRGVTPGLGALLVIYPPSFLAALGSGAVVIAATRFVSLGSLSGTFVGAVTLLWAVAGRRIPPPAALYALLVGGFIFVSHRDNIQRLIAGRERKLGEKTQE